MVSENGRCCAGVDFAVASARTDALSLERATDHIIDISPRFRPVTSRWWYHQRVPCSPGPNCLRALLYRAGRVEVARGTIGSNGDHGKHPRVDSALLASSLCFHILALTKFYI